MVKTPCGDNSFDLYYTVCYKYFMDNDRHDPHQYQLIVRIDSTLKKRLKNFAKSVDKTQTEVIRTYISTLQ